MQMSEYSEVDNVTQNITAQYLSLCHLFRAITVISDNAPPPYEFTDIRSDNDSRAPRAITIKSDNLS
jgi:hypothetical protein